MRVDVPISFGPMKWSKFRNREEHAFLKKMLWPTQLGIWDFRVWSIPHDPHVSHHSASSAELFFCLDQGVRLFVCTTGQVVLDVVLLVQGGCGGRNIIRPWETRDTEGVSRRILHFMEVSADAKWRLSVLRGDATCLVNRNAGLCFGSPWMNWLKQESTDFSRRLPHHLPRKIVRKTGGIEAMNWKCLVIGRWTPSSPQSTCQASSATPRRAGRIDRLGRWGFSECNSRYLPSR